MPHAHDDLHGVDARRDHSLRIPRPDLAKELGTPDACTKCHTNQTQEWAADWFVKWWGAGPRNAHYGEILASARRNEPGSFEKLAALAADTTRPPSSAPPQSRPRPSAAHRLKRPRSSRDASPIPIPACGPRPSPPSSITRPTSGSPSPADCSGIRRVPCGPRRPGFSRPHTRASTRRRNPPSSAPRPSSRTNRRPSPTAPRATCSSPPFTSTRETSRRRGLLPPRPESRTRVHPGAHQLRRDAFLAEPSRRGRVGVSRRHRDRHDRQRPRRRARESRPIPHPDEALRRRRRRVETAAGLLPDSAETQYFYGVALNSLGRFPEALPYLEKARELAPRHLEYLIGLATVCRDAGKGDLALKYAREALALEPDNPQLQQLVTSLGG